MYINVSKDFKKKSKAAIFSIIIFILVYLLLFSVSILLVIGCIAAGIAIIAAKPMFLTIMLGLGLVGTSICIFIFIIKFLFKKHINDLSNLTEIKRKDAPKLFRMIDEIVEEAQTDFPKKVYLTYDVNASVFYDSSFWSMFLPIKKNLTIGMGLINTTTQQELKAILAHEFGHFSQKSMKVGSYVYNVNQIIFNIVNDDASFKSMMEKWSSISNYFSLFAAISIFFTNQIQKILVKMYSFVNIRHMALSREMEFHADEVAVNIAGSIYLEEALLRLELGEMAYSTVINYYEEKFSENKYSQNIYKEQSAALHYHAEKNNLKYKYNLPVVELSKSMLFNSSKLVITDQWASHPSLEDRISRIKKLNIEKEGDLAPAKELFDNYIQIEEKLTSKIFNNVKYKVKPTANELEVFISDIKTKDFENSFNPFFNGYYDQKNIDFSVRNNDLETPTEIDSYFNNNAVEKVYTLNALNRDIETIKAISEKQIKIKTFDYDGEKYTNKEASSLSLKLEKEKQKLIEEIEINDKKIYNYFFHKAKENGNNATYIEHYQNLEDLDQFYDEDLVFYHELLNATQFIEHRLNPEEIKKYLLQLNPLEEKLKTKINTYLDDESLKPFFSEQQRKDLRYFASNFHLYFNQDSYLEDNIKNLAYAINTIPFVNSKRYFAQKKKLLDFMSSLEIQQLEKQLF